MFWLYNVLEYSLSISIQPSSPDNFPSRDDPLSFVAIISTLFHYLTQNDHGKIPHPKAYLHLPSKKGDVLPAKSSNVPFTATNDKLKIETLLCSTKLTQNGMCIQYVFLTSYDAFTFFCSEFCGSSTFYNVNPYYKLWSAWALPQSEVRQIFDAIILPVISCPK